MMKNLSLAAVDFRAPHIEARCSLMLFCKSLFRLTSFEPPAEIGKAYRFRSDRTPTKNSTLRMHRVRSSVTGA